MTPEELPEAVFIDPKGLMGNTPKPRRRRSNPQKLTEEEQLRFWREINELESPEVQGIDPAAETVQLPDGQGDTTTPQMPPQHVPKRPALSPSKQRMLRRKRRQRMFSSRWITENCKFSQSL